ncbi:MAG: type II secretion system F family protein [Hyphomicrobiaceae bacterium]|nr:type II secretion system F family protein [Hyphomicrobiaceae bacterium]
MLSTELVLALAAVAAGAVAYSLFQTYFSGDRRAEKRRQSVTENKSVRVARASHAEQASNRRKAVAETLKEIEQRQKSKQKVTLRVRLQRAGLDISTNAYWIASAVSGLTSGVLVMMLFPSIPIVTGAAGAFVGAFGLPHWVLNRLTKRRQGKFMEEFANAIDVIVRGVKSGLPLNDCLGIIARESPQPIGGEFRDLVEQQRVGVPLFECFDRMIVRMPLAEVKFFAIVVAIQQQAGGNLSEALGNLSGVLRDRKRLQAKVKALSAEAKASAAVLGALPFIVMSMVYVTTPNYIAFLWTTKTGQFLLAVAAIWMTMGLLVMRKMINFKY